MKQFLNCLLSASLILTFAGCKKLDFHHFKSYEFNKCGVSKYWTHWDCPPCDQWDTLFSITYNKATGYPEFIRCAFRTFAEPAGPYFLHVNYLQGKVIVKDESTDIQPFLTVWLNNAHRPDSTVAFDPQSEYTYHYRFKYQYGRLNEVYQSVIDRFGGNSGFHQLFRMTYDQYGNIIRMAADSLNEGSTGTGWFGYNYEYTYNYAVADKQQFYLEEVNDGLKPFILMRYLGMFDELQPHHERILVDETDRGYQDYYGTNLINHHYNQWGQLTDYSWPGSLTWNIVWKCK